MTTPQQLLTSAHTLRNGTTERQNTPMKNVRCYDNGGKTADRYTAVYTDQPERQPGHFACVGMSAYPFHPQGFGQHSTAMLGRHLGKQIRFAELPADCQRLIVQDRAHGAFREHPLTRHATGRL